MSHEMEEKIALFCDVDKEAVIQVEDADTIYEVPLNLRNEGMDDIVVGEVGTSMRRA